MAPQASSAGNASLPATGEDRPQLADDVKPMTSKLPDWYGNLSIFIGIGAVGVHAGYATVINDPFSLKSYVKNTLKKACSNSHNGPGGFAVCT